VSWQGHPPSFGEHPWTDPLAPQDLFAPRPDGDLALAGALAPRPEDFPFTDQGRADYYAAVSNAANMMRLQQIHVHDARLQQAAGEQAAFEAAEQHRRAAFLLLMGS
jgi:hypothetical protein